LNKFCPFINIDRSIAATVCSHLQDILDCTVPEDGSCKLLQNVVTIYEFTMRHIQKVLNINNTAVRNSDCTKLSPLITSIYLRHMNSKLANLMHTQQEYRTYTFISYTCSIQLVLNVINATYREHVAVWSLLLPSNAQFETKCRQLSFLHS
jgi:hypothetical protein